MTSTKTNTFVTADEVVTAVNKVPSSQKLILLGFETDGNLAQSTGTNPVTTPPPDQKLWIIGAVLGPVLFVLLMIMLSTFLYFKCRKRDNRTMAEVYS